jgi:hypothetical protein
MFNCFRLPDRPWGTGSAGLLFDNRAFRPDACGCLHPDGPNQLGLPQAPLHTKGGKRMRTGGKIVRGLLLVVVLGMLLPPLLIAEEGGESITTALRAAGICEPCNVNADCDSNNCGVNVNDPNDKRCIPAGAQSYNCTTESSDSG